MTKEPSEEFAKASQAFPELDEAARRRAQERADAGAEAHAALAQESVMLNMVRAYNQPYERRRS
jgi:hypothetical protein